MSGSQRNARLCGLLPATLAASVSLGLGCLESGYVLREKAEMAAQGGAGTAPEPAAAGQAGAQEPGPASCDATFQSGPNFAVCSAEYWGSNGADRLLGAAITPRDEVIVAGSTAAVELGVPTLTVAGAGSGVLERRNAGGALLSAARWGSEVTAVVAVREGLLAASDQGLALFDAHLENMLAENPLGAVARVAGSAAGAVALLADGRVLVLDASLTLQRELPLVGAKAEDVAIADSGLTLVTGSRAATAGGECLGRLPFLRAFSGDGTPAYGAYDFDDAPGWCASSTGKRLSIKDGKLYYAGEQEGGNSVHTRDPHDLALQAPLVSYDIFSNGAGKAIDVYSFVARFELASGALETAQVIVPRDGMVGGTLFTSALVVDQAGRIFLGGEVSCCIEARETRSVAGQMLGPYTSPELSLLVLSADLRERVSWTSFSGAAPSDAQLSALVLGGEGGVLLANVGDAPSLLTVPAGLAAPGGGDAYAVLFPTP